MTARMPLDVWLKGPRSRRSPTMVVRSDCNGHRTRMSGGGKAEELFLTCCPSIDHHSNLTIREFGRF